MAVVRISGPRADDAVLALAGRLPEPRRASLATLRRQGELLDNALVIRFPGPASATGEDVVELHLHGGRSVVAAVLEALGSLEGLRQARPGEFTRRAVENGRIDLTEAEGLADLLMAETQSQRRSALALAGGALRRRVEEWQKRILQLAAAIEAVLDFSDEEDVGEALPAHVSAGLLSLGNDMRAYLLSAPQAERLRDGIRVAIAGPPNAGKSSLFNVLAGREAAIISEHAGTTRDIIEAPTALGGTPFLLIDTAGLRPTQDPVEAIGVGRAEASIEVSDIILWLGDPDEAPPRAILVHPKADLGGPRPGGPKAMPVSSLTGEGVDALQRLLVEEAAKLLPGEGEAAINARHRSALNRCVAFMDEAISSEDPLIAAEALRASRVELDAITGRAGVEDMLDALFADFCIGK